MNFIRVITLIIIMLFYISPNTTKADTGVNTKKDYDIPTILLEKLTRHVYKEQYISSVLGIIRNNASDHITLKVSDLQALDEKLKQNYRAQKMSQILPYDKDFDGIITRDEVSTALSSKTSSTQRNENAVQAIMRIDLDENNEITREEIVSYSDHEFENRYMIESYPIKDVKGILSLNKDRDQVTLNELKDIALRAFHEYDKNGNDIIEEDEMEHLKTIYNKQNELDKILSLECSFPPPKNNEKIIFIGTSHGKAISTISVAGQTQETSVIPVHIDQDDENLYIIASASNPVIWQFTGDIQNVSQLVLAGNKANDKSNNINIASSGIPQEKVSFADIKECGLRHANKSHHKQYQKDITIRALEKLLGKEPELFLSQDSLLAVHIFGDRINTDNSEEFKNSQEKTPKGFEKALWRKHLETTDGGGLIDLDIETIVSDSKAEDYEVLPRWAGFSKLAYEGRVVSIKNVNNSDIVISKSGGEHLLTIENIDNLTFSGLRSNNHNPKINFSVGNRVKIIKNIPYYPTGLHGGHSAEIIIGKGVDIPQGNPGHSKVFLEETGEQISGR